MLVRHLSEDGTYLMAEAIQDIMNNNYIEGEAYAEGRGVVAVEIEWGDHEEAHSKLDDLVLNKYWPDRIDEYITEGDTDSTYSSTHYYYFY